MTQLELTRALASSGRAVRRLERELERGRSEMRIPEPAELEREWVLDKLGEAAEQRRELDRAMHELATRAMELGVPMTTIARTAFVDRKTVYRWTGRRYGTERKDAA